MFRVNKTLVSIGLFCLSFGASLGFDEVHANTSAYRFPGERFEEAQNRSQRNTPSLESDLESEALTASNMAKPLDQLNKHLIPEWPDPKQIQEAFIKIRDDRFLFLPEENSSPKTISWAYVEDGCSSRAAVASEHLEEFNLRRPAKLFIFGELSLTTPQQGEIFWWYHVALVVASQGNYYVLDPAVEPSQPLLVEQWAAKITSDLSQATLSVCNPFSYAPWSMCYVSGPLEESSARDEQLDYLRMISSSSTSS